MEHKSIDIEKGIPVLLTSTQKPRSNFCACMANFRRPANSLEFDGEKECVSYKVSYPDQSCIFRSAALPFGFSDHKNVQLDKFWGSEAFFRGSSD